jgi:hypothetical protein
MCSIQRSRKAATVMRDGSTWVPLSSPEMRRAHSRCASRLLPLKECQRCLRLPVESGTSMTMAQWPGERSRM